MRRQVLGVAFGSDNRSSKACATKISNQAIFSKLTQKHANDTQRGMTGRFVTATESLEMCNKAE